MKSGFPNIREARFRGGISGLALVLSLIPVVAAQGPGQDGVELQREAMSKLSFLAGKWSGPVSVVRGPGEPVHLTQTEQVEYKLDGLVLLIEGKSTDGSGKSSFEALATVAYDEATHAYRFRAYNGGHYIDTELDGVARWVLVGIQGWAGEHCEHHAPDREGRVERGDGGDDGNEPADARGGDAARETWGREREVTAKFGGDEIPAEI